MDLILVDHGKNFTLVNFVITARKRSCGEVMFLLLSVSHSVHRGEYIVDNFSDFFLNAIKNFDKMGGWSVLRMKGEKERNWKSLSICSGNAKLPLE